MSKVLTVLASQVTVQQKKVRGAAPFFYDIYFGPAYVFMDDGDQDILPMHWATDKDIKDGSIVEGWFARWTTSPLMLDKDGIRGDFLGPYITEIAALGAAVQATFDDGIYAALENERRATEL